MIPLVLTEDANGKAFGSGGMRQPSLIDNVKLTAHTGVTLTIPTGAKHVLFSYPVALQGLCYVQYTSDALTSALYAASSSQVLGVDRTGMGAELNPVMRTIAGVTGLGIISSAAGSLTLSWFG